ncbi:MAG: hypothetical protein ACOCQD_04075 [archaeon]
MSTLMKLVLSTLLVISFVGCQHLKPVLEPVLEDVDWEQVSAFATSTLVQYLEARAELRELEGVTQDEIDAQNRALEQSYIRGAFEYIRLGNDMEKEERLERSFEVAEEYAKEVHGRDLLSLTVDAFEGSPQEETMSKKELAYSVLMANVQEELD